MKIEINQITNGSYDDKFVWISDYRYTEFPNKAIRHVKPQKVLVKSNTEVKKRINYSSSHFVALGLNDNPTKKIIVPYDNTGFRSYAGIPVNVFDNEEECKQSYKEQCELILKRLEVWFNDLLVWKSDLVDELSKHII